MRLYHVTSADRAGTILCEGFKDGRGHFMTDRDWSGVWLSDAPFDASQGDEAEALLSVELPARLIAKYEWREVGKPYREWLVPASVVNNSARVRRIR